MKLENKTEIAPLTQDDLVYVWQNIRERDKEEVTLQGLNELNLSHILTYKEAYVGKVDGEPVCVIAVAETGACLWLIFFATDKVNDYMKTLTKHAKIYLNYLKADYIGKRRLVSVWEKHTDSIAWLKLLGFKKTGKRIGNKEKFYIMEHSK